MATNPKETIKISLYDQSSESTSFSANQPAQIDISGGLPLIVTNFITAINATAGIVDFSATDLKSATSNQFLRVSNDKQGVGNREDKWLLNMQDSVTLVPFDVEIPCRTGGVATVPGTDYLPEVTVALFRTEAEALFFSNDGNPANLLTVTLVGRRS